MLIERAKRVYMLLYAPNCIMGAVTLWPPPLLLLFNCYLPFKRHSRFLRFDFYFKRRIWNTIEQNQIIGVLAIQSVRPVSEIINNHKRILRTIDKSIQLLINSYIFFLVENYRFRKQFFFRKLRQINVEAGARLMRHIVLYLKWDRHMNISNSRAKTWPRLGNNSRCEILIQVQFLSANYTKHFSKVGVRHWTANARIIEHLYVVWPMGFLRLLMWINSLIVWSWPPGMWLFQKLTITYGITTNIL